jgi:two-component system OmpR family sensor kinase
LTRISFRPVPLRARLALAFASGMAVVLIGVAAFVYVQLRHDLLDAIDAGLQSRAQVVVANARRPDPSLGGRARHLIDADEAFAQVLTPTARIVEATPAVAASPLVGRSFLRTVERPTFVERKPPRIDAARLLVVPAQVRGRPGFVVVGGTLSDEREALGRVRRLFAVAFPAALALCTVIGWALATTALRPVERMRREADAVTAADIGRRLPVPATDPTLARLATTLNRTFDRLQAALQRERRFVDDASHELRTPLTILKAEIDTALTGDRDRRGLERTLEAASDEVDHLVRIAEHMLVLARAEHGTIALHRVETPLPELLDQGARIFAGRAARERVRIEVESANVVVWVDRTRMRQALDNLIDNAIRHSPAGAVVRITGSTSADTVTITVADEGAGFAADVLPNAFEPFARSAGSAYEGSGLGLAVVALVAEAHGGSATARNGVDGGAQVMFTIAAAAPRPPSHMGPEELSPHEPVAHLGSDPERRA